LDHLVWDCRDPIKCCLCLRSGHKSFQCKQSSTMSTNSVHSPDSSDYHSTDLSPTTAAAMLAPPPPTMPPPPPSLRPRLRLLALSPLPPPLPGGPWLRPMWVTVTTRLPRC
jgi:hypothetical protein